MLGDLTEFLRSWKFDGQNTVRMLSTVDGREIMQVRLPLGVEQIELEGRPDGIRPDGFESMLDVCRNRLNQALADGEIFEISRDEFALLQSEGMLYYQRYLVLFQLGEYGRTCRDTDHNLALCDLVEEYYSEDDKVNLLQYRPYILRVNAVAGAMLDLNEGNGASARKRLEKTAEIVKNMSGVASPIFEFEKMRAIQHLNAILDQIQERSLSKHDLLERELYDAVEREEYERAARIRDQLREIGGDEST